MSNLLIVPADAAVDGWRRTAELAAGLRDLAQVGAISGCSPGSAPPLSSLRGGHGGMLILFIEDEARSPANRHGDPDQHIA